MIVENILPIVVYDNEILRKECKDLKVEDVDQTLIDRMFDTMVNAKGVGLAAPQVGLNIKLFVADISFFLPKKINNDGKVVCINPVIEYPKDNSMIIESEGCLSIPGLSYNVSRYDKIIIKYYDREFKYHNEMYEGWPSRILQHETDHLYQRLYVDYVPYFDVRDDLNRIKNKNFICNYLTKE